MVQFIASVQRVAREDASVAVALWTVKLAVAAALLAVVARVAFL